VLGADGEDLAARWYEARGYRIVARNWRCPLGEIDLIAVRGATLAVVEVKTRRSAVHGSPAHAVGPAKQARLRRLAAAWLATGGPRRRYDLRFDVVAVTVSGPDPLVEPYLDAF